jgi:hypothetical protein
VRPDKDQPAGSQLLEPLAHRHRAVVERLERDAVAQRLARQPLERDAPEVEVALVQLTDRPDDDRQSAPQAHVLTSRTMLPAPVCTCVVHGMHGSKLRMARSMSIEVKRSGSAISSRIGVRITASS